jgi:subtilisin family serine protease
MLATRFSALFAALALTACLDVTSSDSVSVDGVAPIGNTGTPIQGRYIITMVDSLPPSALSDILGEAVLDTLPVAPEDPAAIRSSMAGGTIALDLSDSLVAALQADPRVVSVEPDVVTGLSGTETNPRGWALDRIDQRAVSRDNSFSWPNDGTGVTIYVIDTGILPTHNEFGSRASLGPSFDATSSTSQECHGHGTAVASAAAGATVGLARGARVVAIRTMGCNGSGAASASVDALNWIVANGVRPAVINMSLGTNNAVIEASNTAALRAIAAGFTVVTAAGNSNAVQCLMYPQRTVGVINVGATSASDARASFSNFGGCLALFAPGADVLLAEKSGVSSFASTNGTSFSAPYTAGAAAQYLSRYPNATAAAVRRALMTLSTKRAVSSAGTGTTNPNLLYVPPAANGFDAVPPGRDTLSLIRAVTNSASTLSLVELDTTTLTVSITAQDGSPVDGKTPTFQSSHPLVATVSPAGRVTAVGPGTATITTRVDGRTATTSVSVTARTADAASATLAREYVPIGTSTTVTFSLLDSADRPLSFRNRQVSVSTSDRTIATLPASCRQTTATSLVCTTRGAARGTATLGFTSGGLTGSAVLQVTEAPRTIALTPSSVQSLVVGRTLQMSAAVRGASGQDVPGQTVTWTSSNTRVATVSASGVVTAVAPGTASITAAIGTIRASISVIVTSQ